MRISPTRIGRFSLWNALRNAHVRSGLYLWFLIAGLCVLLANAVAAGW